ncbi:MAG: sodium:solute symporter [Acidobacteria bacterium]|nr:sodium:solute symporter [Acidobacteriota bacterium]
MSIIDWIVLTTTLVAIVVYGVWKGRGSHDMQGYLLAGREMRWTTITLSIMATQASAITFLSTPGQAYADGMRFVQFYLGLPLAMVILSATAVPIYHRLKVFTAYEYLESRFDLKTRALAAFLFLIQRGLACGFTIFAPSLVLSVLFGWNIYITNLVIGILVIIYTTSGGTRAVSWTQFQQMLVITGGMVGAFLVILYLLPDTVSFTDAFTVAGRLGRLNAIDFSFDLSNRYNIWSGLIGGFFLALSYFGTDQSQVQRYLTGKSVTHSRMGLLANGMVKVPMQFFILLIGAMVFVFYLFVAPPLFFNPVVMEKVQQGPLAPEYSALQEEYQSAFMERRVAIEMMLMHEETGNTALAQRAEERMHRANDRITRYRQAATDIIRDTDPGADTNDVNYIFLTFVIHFLPVGLVGLVIAAIFSASMSSTSSELNALASTTVVDIIHRLTGRRGTDRQQVRLSRVVTVFWGGLAILFAQYANRMGTLVEAINILGSLFYGTILGIFLVAFYLKRVRGAAAFYAAIVAEVAVLACFLFTDISFLWYNVVGCAVVIGLSLPVNALLQRAGR